MNKGKIVQVMGPVVDVEFENNDLPYIKDALEVDNNGKKCIMEVAQHIGNNTVRCIMLSSSEGLCRDMEVVATGSGIKVPVGDKTLGRLFNVVGETIDGGESLENENHWVIHRDPPTFEDQSPVVEVLETGIKVIDLLAPYAKGGKIGLFGGAGVGKTVHPFACPEAFSRQAKRFHDPSLPPDARPCRPPSPLPCRQRRKAVPPFPPRSEWESAQSRYKPPQFPAALCRLQSCFCVPPC